MSITDFLNARIAEDEAAARAAIDPSGMSSSSDGEWELAEYPYEGEWPRNPDAENVLWADSDWALHASRHDPARVLAECAAKRAIVEDVTHSDEETRDYVIRTLAAVYADHPAYLDEWRVGV